MEEGESILKDDSSAVIVLLYFENWEVRSKSSIKRFMVLTLWYKWKWICIESEGKSYSCKLYCTIIL